MPCASAVWLLSEAAESARLLVLLSTSHIPFFPRTSRPYRPPAQPAARLARPPAPPSESTADCRAQIIAELHDARALPPTRPARVCSAELRTPVPPLTVLEAGSQPARIPT